ncbi:glycosyltransferase family 2 protein [Clostridia bacterium]|nr:glycosyltransferase family 2 protein [Clostridia bacterium]
MIPDLSISFLVFNNETILYDNLWNLVEALPSALSCHLYVIDNHSKDNSWQEMERFQADFEVNKADYGHVFLELVANTKNVGFGRGHNLLLKKLKSNYHLVMNPDIRLEGKEQLASMIFFMEQEPEIGLLVPKLKNMDGSCQCLCKRNPTLLDLMIRRLPLAFLRARQEAYVMMESGYDQTMDIEYASGCFMLFRTECFQLVEGFDERFFLYLEDADISRRIKQASRVVFYPHAQVTHGWYRGTYRSPKLFFINILSIFKYFNKWGWKLW